MKMRKPELYFQGKKMWYLQEIFALQRGRSHSAGCVRRRLLVACFSSQVRGVGRILCLTLLSRQLQEGKGRGLRAAACLVSAKFYGCLPPALCCSSSAPLAAWSYGSPWCIQILLGWIS